MIILFTSISTIISIMFTLITMIISTSVLLLRLRLLPSVTPPHYAMPGSKALHGTKISVISIKTQHWAMDVGSNLHVRLVIFAVSDNDSACLHLVRRMSPDVSWGKYVFLKRTSRNMAGACATMSNPDQLGQRPFSTVAR